MKKFLALMLALIMTLSVIPFAAAADHEHYDNNGNEVCDYDGCKEVVHSKHYDDNGNGVCDYTGCTAAVSSTPAHVHTDENGNGVCDYDGCSEKTTAHKHNDANKNGVCDYPGCKVQISTDPIGPGTDKPSTNKPVTEGKHTYYYEYTANRHWLECVCGEIKANSYGDHRLNSNGKCSVCGYKKYGYGYDYGYSKYYGDYRVTLKDNGKGDTELSTRYADKGDTVYIYTDADYGYRLLDIEVYTRYSYSSNIKLTKRSNGVYSFRMPSGDVTVEVTYSGSKYAFDYGYGYDKDVYGSYSDVDSNAWYYSAVKYVTDREIMEGYTYNKFSPSVNMTRAALAEALYAIANSPSAGRENFSDVDSYDDFCEAVAWCASKNIIKGWNGKFMPNGDVTREDLAVMLYRFAEVKRYDTDAYADLDKFNDAEDVSAYAVEALEWAVGAGILSGTDKGDLNPQGTTTRAEAAAMLMRFCKGIG